MTSPSVSSAYLESCHRYNSQNHGDDVETDNYLCFVPSAALKMMVQRCHLEETTPLPIAPLRILEVEHLQDN